MLNSHGRLTQINHNLDGHHSSTYCERHFVTMSYALLPTFQIRSLVIRFTVRSDALGATGIQEDPPQLALYTNRRAKRFFAQRLLISRQSSNTICSTTNSRRHWQYQWRLNTPFETCAQLRGYALRPPRGGWAARERGRAQSPRQT